MVALQNKYLVLLNTMDVLWKIYQWNMFHQVIASKWLKIIHKFNTTPEKLILKEF